jgi:hypothetical protein
MSPPHNAANWERPFLAVQCTRDHLVTWYGELPGIVQLGLYPCALAGSLLHLPFVLSHLLISEVINKIAPPELPVLTREELCEWARTTRVKWVARHESLRQCNPADVADGIALPVITALEKAIDGLDGHDVNPKRLNQLASQLIALPAATAPDVQAIGLCIQRHTRQLLTGR